MIDIETLDTSSTAVILSIGMVKFDPYSDQIFTTLEIKPTIDDQVALGRTIDDATMNWWSKQSPIAIEAAFSDKDRISFKDAMEVSYNYAWNQENIWSHGILLDITVMESAFKQTLTDRANPVPWPYHIVRDTRTVYQLTDVSLRSEKFKTKTTHNAVEDAVHQCKVLQESFKRMKIAREKGYVG